MALNIIDSCITELGLLMRVLVLSKKKSVLGLSLIKTVVLIPLPSYSSVSVVYPVSVTWLISVSLNTCRKLEN